MVLLSNAEPADEETIISTKTAARFEACELWAFHEVGSSTSQGLQGWDFYHLFLAREPHGWAVLALTALSDSLALFSTRPLFYHPFNAFLKSFLSLFLWYRVFILLLLYLYHHHFCLISPSPEKASRMSSYPQVPALLSPSSLPLFFKCSIHQSPFLPLCSVHVPQ